LDPQGSKQVEDVQDRIKALIRKVGLCRIIVSQCTAQKT